MEEMQANMAELMKSITLAEINHTTRITTAYEPEKEMGIALWLK